MVTQSQKNTQNASKAAVGTLPTNAAEAVMAAGKGSRKGLFSGFQTEMSKSAADKVSLLGSVRQKLAQAVDLYNEGGSKAAEADGIRDKALVPLYQARADNLIGSEEVTATLGDIFGFKSKKDGSPSKTPDGRGEDIRKRVVRLAAAKAFVSTGDGGAFFDNVSEDTFDPDDDQKRTVADVLKQVEEGDISPWSAYDLIGKIRQAARGGREPFHLDPSKISGLVSKLAEKATIEAIAGNPSLIAAYAALYDMLRTLDETGTPEPEENETKH